MLERIVRARLIQVCGSLAGLLVLLVSVVTGVVSARNEQAAEQDRRLGITLGQQVDTLTSYFERARTIDLLLADNPVFADFYRAAGTDRQKIAAGGPLMRRVNDALTYVETLFPGQVGEACFIDSSGAEIARVVAGVPADQAHLSPDEDENAFFAPTLALGPGKVYQAPEYVSPDTHREVISNSTVVEAAGRQGLVHFEIDLNSFRMPAASGGVATSVVDAQSGRVVIARGGAAALSGTTALGSTASAKGLDDGEPFTLGHRRLGIRRLPEASGNANDWYVAVSAPAVGTGWSHGLSVRSLGLVAAALLTILVAGLSWRTRARAARRAATYDALTGLPNRTLFSERLRAMLSAGNTGAVLTLDLERFQEVNETLGNRHGDLLLQQIADRLTRVAVPGAVVARLGGDDFAVLLPGAGRAAAQSAATQIVSAMHSTFHIDGAGVDVEVRIGLALSPDHGLDAETLLRHADTARYRAKEHHDGYFLYEATADDRATGRLELLGELRRALATDDQITLHYQPKIRMAGDRLAGVEALVRWEHPHRGRLAPDSFLPLAENTTLIHGLTSRVLDIAVRQARQWLDQGLAIPVAVNISARSLQDIGLPERVFDLLDRFGLPTSLLEIEITESMIMVDPVRAAGVLQRLHDGGIRLSLDDYGTGHSSMAYLQRLPLDTLKVDKSFVQDMTTNQPNAVLVRSAIDVAHHLGLSVVAEGVEDAATVAALDDLGCDIVQGYHYARPMPGDALLEWLNARAALEAARTEADGPAVVTATRR